MLYVLQERGPWDCAQLWIWFMCYYGKSTDDLPKLWDETWSKRRKWTVTGSEEKVNSNRQWEPVIGPRGSKPVHPSSMGSHWSRTTWGIRELPRRVVDSQGALCEVLFHMARFPKPTQCKRLNDSTKDVSWINQTDHCQRWSSSWNSPGPVPTYAAWISTKSRFQSRFQVKLINAWPDLKLECLW